MNGQRIKARRYWNFLQLFLATLFVMMTQSWLADGLAGPTLFEDWFGAERAATHRVCILAVVFLVSLMAWWWLISLRRLFLPARTLAQGQVQPRKVLIMMVSPKDYVRLSKSNDVVTVTHGTTDIPMTGELSKDIEALRWKWQQLLRALVPHISEGKLEMVYLIGTRDKTLPDGKINPGSYRDLNDCVSLLELYLGSGMVRPYREGIDSENLSEIQTAIEEIVSWAKADHHKDNDIIIDVTGGQKTQSIAGALVALTSPRLEFQYVETNPPFHVIGYNVVNEYLPD